MIIHACAPTSMLDLGNWTDTPFAEHGAILNMAIDYPVRVTIRPRRRPGVMIRTQVMRRIHGNGGGERSCPMEYDLLRSAAQYFGVEGVEADLSYHLPPECGLSATAAAMVAMTAALAHYAGKSYAPHQLATVAHQLHSAALDQPLGLHGHMAAAQGGIALYRITPHPRIFTSPVLLTTELISELHRRLLLVLTGRTPRSDFLSRLATCCQPGDKQVWKTIWDLRAIPGQAMEAISRWDFRQLGAVIAEGAALQERLCPALRTPETRYLDILAQRCGALAAKTNGEGGSVSLFGAPESINTLERMVRESGYEMLPVRLNDTGLRVWADQDECPQPLRTVSVT